MTRFIPTILFLSACTTGGNYPEQYAKALCETTYACLDDDDIETVSGYDDMDECIVELTSEIRSSDVYDEWEEGARSFNKEAASGCITEIEEVQQDSDCDGSMSAWTFFTDIQSDDCDDVFPATDAE